MKLHLTLLVLSGLLLGASGNALAEDKIPPPPPAPATPSAPSATSPRPEGGGRPERGRDIGDLLKRADTNGDGKITKEEFIEHGKKELEERFKRLDANGDGVIDKSEIETMTKRMQEFSGKARERFQSKRGTEGLRKKPADPKAPDNKGV